MRDEYEKKDLPMRDMMRGKYARTAAIGLITALLATASPRPAQAFVVACPDCDAAITTLQGSTLAQWAIQFKNTITDEMQRAAGIASQQMSTDLQAKVSTKNTQSLVDQLELSELDKSVLDITKQYTTHPDKTKICDEVGATQAQEAMGGGMKQLGGQMNPPNQNVGQTPAKALATACANGNINPDEYPGLKQASTNCAKANPNPNRYDADINYATVSSDSHMQIPAGISSKDGALTLPAANNSMTDDQLHFLDAMRVCINKLPPAPASFAGAPGSAPASQVTTAILGVHQQRMDKLAASPTYKDCVATVLYNTAIPQDTASKAGGSFQTYYTAEVDECEALNTLKIMDDGKLSDCKKNGISLADLDKLKANRYSGDTYAQYRTTLVGENLTPEDIGMLKERNMDTNLVLDALNRIEATLHVMAFNSMPGVSGVGPTGLDQAVKP
ncbi:MAG: hypothetical protein KGI97_04240 [Alphaproteobacteria bacterium]|nr:hypothetical protein [Alphaproteobacteria bacterium]